MASWADLVVRRTREIGTRMALGADRTRMLRMVLLDGLRPVIEGLLLGIGLGVMLRMLFRPWAERLARAEHGDYLEGHDNGDACAIPPDEPCQACFSKRRGL